MKSPNRHILRLILLGIQIILLIPIGWFIWHLVMPRGYSNPQVETIPLALSSGPFNLLYFPAKSPRGVLIVATGDGGWSGQWEEPVARHASEAGIAVGGWDCRKFADTRSFDQVKLVEAFNASVKAVRARAGLPDDCPVWYTGWSTGAEWSIAAAASPVREKHLLGVLAAAPGDRSRYGITASDLMGLPVEGERSFALTDLVPALKGVAIVQFAAGLDPMDDVNWLDSLGKHTPHKLVTIPDVPHDMGCAGVRFLAEFERALQWIEDHPPE